MNWPRLPTPPLFVQALGLVIATLTASYVAAMVVIFNMPTPTPDIYRLSEVVQAASTDRTTETRDGIPLITHMDWRAPSPAAEGRRAQEFRSALAEALGKPVSEIVVAQTAPRFVAFFVPRGQLGGPRGPRALGAAPLLFGEFRVGVRQPDARWLVIQPRPTVRLDPWQQRVLLVLGLTGLIVTPLAWWFARRMSAPIAAFAKAAERLGRDPRAPPLAIRGPLEVNSAVAAFNQMQERLSRYVDDRTAMVAAIAHDLRTPLTRLRFRVESAPEDIQGKIAADIDEMDAMIAATLAFVKDSARPRARTRLELSSLVETVMDEAALTGADAAVECSDRLVVEGDPLALKRLFTNLSENALKFGKKARARVFARDGMAVVEIEDNGPGMPEAELERAFEPFHRLEGSRSRDTGGIGLGLAVVRAVARGHGGDVTLHNRDHGGLIARVALPL